LAFAALGGLGRRQAGGELRPAIERVGALARLGLDVFGQDGHALGLGEPRNRGSFGLNSDAPYRVIASRDCRALLLHAPSHDRLINRLLHPRRRAAPKATRHNNDQR